MKDKKTLHILPTCLLRTSVLHWSVVPGFNRKRCMALKWHETTQSIFMLPNLVPVHVTVSFWCRFRSFHSASFQKCLSVECNFWNDKQQLSFHSVLCAISVVKITFWNNQLHPIVVTLWWPLWTAAPKSLIVFLYFSPFGTFFPWNIAIYRNQKRREMIMVLSSKFLTWRKARRDFLRTIQNQKQHILCEVDSMNNVFNEYSCHIFFPVMQFPPHIFQKQLWIVGTSWWIPYLVMQLHYTSMSHQSMFWHFPVQVGNG